VSKDQPPDSAAEFFPSRKSLKAFRKAAADCTACDLWKRGTQTVFGEGTRRAEIFLSANNPATKKSSPANLLLVRPAGYLTMHLPGPESIARKSMSPT
jgi:DNA polymerase